MKASVFLVKRRVRELPLQAEPITSPILHRRTRGVPRSAALHTSSGLRRAAERLAGNSTSGNPLPFGPLPAKTVGDPPATRRLFHHRSNLDLGYPPPSTESVSRIPTV